MTTALITHAACLTHETGPYHPETAARLKTILDHLSQPEFDDLLRVDACQATDQDLARVHDPDYLKKFQATCQKLIDEVAETGTEKIDHWDQETMISSGTAKAARYAAGAGLTALDLIAAEKCQNAFCAIRPPGHHAEHDKAMGFCFYNNVAVTAAYARQKYGWRKIAIIDFDVHHGNGTQDIFENDPDSFYFSTHQSPLYPGTGGIRETGIDHNIKNIPLPPHTDSALFRRSVSETLMPALHQFMPDLILISAGFDGHSEDEMSQFDLTDQDFIWITQQLMKSAAYECQSRLVSLLEGGYDLPSLSRSVAAHVKTLMGKD